MVNLNEGLTITQVNTSLATLNNISPAEVNAQCDIANIDYDAVTVADEVALNTKIDTIAAESEILENHHHSQEFGRGKSGDQSGNNWGADTLTPYQAISGNSVYGADANDEAKVLGSTDTPIVTGNTFFDLHRMTIVSLSSDTVYEIRIVWGTGTIADAITAVQYSTLYIVTSTDKANKFGGSPFELQLPRLAAGTKVWVQARNATNNATVDFFVELHEYPE